MPGPFETLHIKGHTVGSSNELSFDVLDLARSSADGQKKRSQKAPTGPKPSQGTYHGVAGTATFSNAPEVARRKKERRSRSLRAGTVMLVFAVALVFAGAYAGTRLYHDRVDFSGRFAGLVDRFIEVDRTLAPIDELMVAPFNAAEADERAGMLEAIPELEAKLGSISDEAGAVVSSAMMGVDEAALDEVKAAAAAREDMLDAAESVFTLAIVVNKHVAAADDAWGAVLSADTDARAATGVFNHATTEPAVREALGKTSEAIDGLKGARSAFSQLEKEVPGLDLSAELAYCDKRLESLESAVAASEALLAGDRDAATSANAAYNEADRQAAGLAEGLGTPIADKVRETYDGDIERAQQLYDDARSRATAADSAIRACL